MTWKETINILKSNLHAHVFIAFYNKHRLILSEGKKLNFMANISIGITSKAHNIDFSPGMPQF